MKVLFIHAYYQQPGGEDRVVEFEAGQLERHGHEVEWIRFHNDEMKNWSAARTAAALFWNREAYRNVRARIAAFGPDVIHVQNVFPSLSPSVYWAAEAERIPVVQKLSNYRMFCVNGVLFRDGAVCEKCLGKPVALAGVAHGCYRGSRVMSAGVAATQAAQRLLGTWTHRIAAYVALDEDGKERFVGAGLDSDRVHVKPEGVDIPERAGTGRGGYALYAGRLSPEKGIDTLLEAWTRHEIPIDLVIAGDGPESTRVQAAGNERIQWLGHLAPERLEECLRDAACVVMPSRWLEMFGRTAVEAMAVGTPVVASRLGALRNVVREGVSGIHFDPGDAADLARAVRELIADPDPEGVRIRTRAHAIDRFSPEKDHERLLAIYEAALAVGA